AHVKSISRDKKVEASIHRDFQRMLADSETHINDKFYETAEGVRDLFPSPDGDADEKARKLDLILSQHPWLTHVFLFEADKGTVLRSQPQLMSDKYIRAEHEEMTQLFGGWFGMEGKILCAGMREKAHPISWYPGQAKRADGDAYEVTAFFTLPQLPVNRVVLGGACFDPDYLKQTFFPEMLEELIGQQLTDKSGYQPALSVFPSDNQGQSAGKTLASSAGWGEGKPEVLRNLDDVFRGLTLGIKFQGTSASAIARRWAEQSMIILGVLSLLMTGGLILTYRSVSKEMALARLKSDFVSNVSH